jgi:hypothetical protein
MPVHRPVGPKSNHSTRTQIFQIWSCNLDPIRPPIRKSSLFMDSVSPTSNFFKFLIFVTNLIHCACACACLAWRSRNKIYKRSIDAPTRRSGFIILTLYSSRVGSLVNHPSIHISSPPKSFPRWSIYLAEPAPTHRRSTQEQAKSNWLARAHACAVASKVRSRLVPDDANLNA